MTKVVSPAAELTVTSICLYYNSSFCEPILNDDLKMSFDNVFNEITVYSSDPSINESLKQKKQILIFKEDDSKEKHPYIRRLDFQEAKWNVFRLNRDYVRTIWASEVSTQLMTGSDELETIPNTPVLLPSLISSFNNSPYGDPIYISPILTSLTTLF